MLQADSLVYQTEKQLKELGDKVPAEIKTKVEAKANELKEVAAKDDTEATKKAIDELQKEVGAAVPHLALLNALLDLETERESSYLHGWSRRGPCGSVSDVLSSNP